MPRGVYKRKKKAGRPKGSRNKIILAMKDALEDIRSPNPKAKMTTWRMETGPLFPTEPASFISRLEAATVKYEIAIKEAIEALKG